MTRLQLARRVCSLLVYVIWRERIWGQPSAVHPTEALTMLVKVLAGADLGGLS